MEIQCTSCFGASLTQRLRIASGLILFTFATTHFLNHAVGLVDLETMHEVQAWRQVVTRSLPGTIVLVLALVTHIGARALQAGAAHHAAAAAVGADPDRPRAAIPFLLLPHIVNTRIAHVFFGVEDNYLYELARLWPASAILQSTLLLIVWLHGCIGIHFWLRLYPPYRAAQPVLLFIAIAVPLAALGGFMVVGAHRRLLDRERADVRQGEGADALAERRRWREPRALPAGSSGSALPASCCSSPCASACATSC